MLEIQMQFVMPIIWQLGHTKKTSSSYHQCATRWLASNPRICRHTHTAHTQTENGQQRTITNLCPPFFSAEVQRLMITPINSAFLQRDVRELAASEFYSELGLFIHQLPLTEMCDCLFFYSNRILLLGGATPVMVVYLCHINSLMVSNSSCILPCNHVSFFNGQLFWQADDLKLSKSNILFSTDYRLAEFSTAFILWGEWIHKVYAWWLCVC